MPSIAYLLVVYTLDGAIVSSSLALLFFGTQRFVCKTLAVILHAIFMFEYLEPFACNIV